MNAAARAELEKKAEAGDVDAQLALADLLNAEYRYERALPWLRRAAETGHVRAKTLLARHYLTQQPFQVEEGLALIFEAAEKGDGEAAHVAAVMTAGGLGVERNWNSALDHLQRSAEAGFALARRELEILSRTEAKPESETDAAHWRRLRDSVDVDAWLAVPRARALSRSPRIAAVEKFLPPEICDWFIERAKPLLEAAQILDSQSGERRVSNQRTNSAFAFDVFRADFLFALQWARIAAITGIPGGAEAPNILHYAVGQSYASHFDFIEANTGDALQLTQGAQRVLTFLVYLNDDYEGGETEFPFIALRHKGRKGNALFFFNIDETGAPDRCTRHTGTAPTKGEKWVFSQWIQARIAPV